MVTILAFTKDKYMLVWILTGSSIIIYNVIDVKTRRSTWRLKLSAQKGFNRLIIKDYFIPQNKYNNEDELESLLSITKQDLLKVVLSGS